MNSTNTNIKIALDAYVEKIEGVSKKTNKPFAFYKLHVEGMKPRILDTSNCIDDYKISLLYEAGVKHMKGDA